MHSITDLLCCPDHCQLWWALLRCCCHCIWVRRWGNAWRAWSVSYLWQIVLTLVALVVRILAVLRIPSADVWSNVALDWLSVVSEQCQDDFRYKNSRGLTRQLTSWCLQARNLRRPRHRWSMLWKWGYGWNQTMAIVTWTDRLYWVPQFPHCQALRLDIDS